MEAVQKSQYNRIEELLKLFAKVGAGTEINAFNLLGMTTLHIAAENNDERSIELLIKYGANPKIADRYKKTPLHIAARLGNQQICEMLVSAGAKIDIEDLRNQTPACIAISEGHEALAEWLLSQV